MNLPRIVIGVDTHAETHVAVALDELGRRIGSLVVPADLAGYRRLLTWSRSLGSLEVAGVEGTGSYGAGLSRFLRSQSISVVEVSRPNRQHTRRHGKSDPADAESAARSVLSGVSLQPKTADSHVESIRTLKYVRSSAIKCRTQAANQIHALLITAPDELRQNLRHLPMKTLLLRAGRFRISGYADPTNATKLCLKFLSRRHRSLTDQISALDKTILLAVESACPSLLQLHGIGPDTASSLLTAIGDNPDRLRTEGSFAHLCGVAPVAASSGKTVRHRLNRGGNRDANRALHVVALVRMSHDSRTKRYVAKRIAEGKTKKEVIRCLKRYIAREVYKVVTTSSKNIQNSS